MDTINIGVIKGRKATITPGSCVACLTKDEDGNISVKIDDITNPEFWMEFAIPSESLKKLLD